MSGGRAGLAGQVRCARARVEVDAIFVLGDFLDGEGDRGGRDIDNRVDVVHIDPLIDDGCCNVGLILMIGENHFDRFIED